MTTPRRLLLLLPLAVLLTGGCRKEDPVAERLATRLAYDVQLTGWNWRGSAETGEAVLNLMLTRGVQQGIDRLTVKVEEVGPDSNAAIASRRVTLDVSHLVYDQPEPVLISLDGVSPRVEEGGFVVFVEPAPDPSTWSEFPELQDLPQP